MASDGLRGSPDPLSSGAGTSRRHQSSWWVLAGTAVTGIGTYVLLVFTARAIGSDSYSDFGVFWAVTVIVGLGLFLPVEQETTRRGAGITAAGGGLGPLWRGSSRVALLSAVSIAAGGWLAWRWVGTAVHDQWGLLVAFAIACLADALLFPSRGLLAAQRQFRAYAVVVMVESVVRAVTAVALWASGVTSVAPYALGVSGSALVAGLTGLVLVARSGSGVGGERVERLGRDTARLVVAASSMQTLLNSGTLVAKLVAAPAQAAVAGQLLAVMTIARLPVLVFQSLQTVYLTRLAGRWHQGDRAGVRRLLALLGLLSGGLAVLLVVGAASFGPWVTTVMFGPDFVVDRITTLLVALGVGIYLVASVASDSSIAVGRHTVIVSAWVAGLVTGGVVVAVASSLLGKATLPLIAGALLAGSVLVVALVRTTMRGRRT